MGKRTIRRSLATGAEATDNPQYFKPKLYCLGFWRADKTFRASAFEGQWKKSSVL